jgi:hypothetical protein
MFDGLLSKFHERNKNMLLLFRKFRIIGKREKGAIPMKKEKVHLIYFRYTGKPIRAKREIAYAIRLEARMSLDVICFKYNRDMLEQAINQSLQDKDEKKFRELSKQYQEFIWK